MMFVFLPTVGVYAQTMKIIIPLIFTTLGTRLWQCGSFWHVTLHINRGIP